MKYLLAEQAIGLQAVVNLAIEHPRLQGATIASQTVWVDDTHQVGIAIQVHDLGHFEEWREALGVDPRAVGCDERSFGQRHLEAVAWIGGVPVNLTGYAPLHPVPPRLAPVPVAREQVAA